MYGILAIRRMGPLGDFKFILIASSSLPSRSPWAALHIAKDDLNPHCFATSS